MKEKGCDLGLVGLGVMGRNFLLNLADRGFSAAGCDLDAAKTERLLGEAPQGSDIHAGTDLGELIGRLKRPRAVMLLVPAGKAVDAVIRELSSRLEEGDLVIDSGNSHFIDTDRRSRKLQKAGMLFIGMGISGGERGARTGPSLMPGGPPEGYARVERMLQKAAAQVDGDPCVAYLGKGSAGHYVKMVHNGIEYGIMQLIAEVYNVLERGLGMGPEELQRVFEGWSRGRLQGYLVEITARILAKNDERTGGLLVDVILDAAEQKGTGMWTSQEAMSLGVPAPVIDAAVAMRNLSALPGQRRETAGLLTGPAAAALSQGKGFVATLEEALYGAMLLTYTEGLALLQRASGEYGFGLDLDTVARIWRGGCIIRAGLLETVRAALHEQPEVPNLLMNARFAAAVSRCSRPLREAAAAALQAGLPAPGLSAAAAFLDAWRSPRLPTNLVQAQRDYFGSHTYKRIDMQGVFHTAWDPD
jgi:6-phosphogluconate dehydrogenase